MNKRLATIAFNLHTRILRIKTQINQEFWVLGKYLKEMRDRKLYKALGYDTFEAYIASPELSIRRSGAYELINIYETLSAHAELADEMKQIDKRKLSRITQFRDREDFPEWVSKAKVLTYEDLSKEILIAKGKEEVRHGRLVRCPKCGFEFYINEPKK